MNAGQSLSSIPRDGGNQEDVGSKASVEFRFDRLETAARPRILQALAKLAEDGFDVNLATTSEDGQPHLVPVTAALTLDVLNTLIPPPTAADRYTDVAVASEISQDPEWVADLSDLAREQFLELKNCVLRSRQGPIREAMSGPSFFSLVAPGLDISTLTRELSAIENRECCAMGSNGKIELQGALESYLEINDVRLRGGDLNGVKFGPIKLIDADFVDADLRGAEFVSALLGYVNVRIGAECGVDRVSADFTGALLNGARFIETRLAHPIFARSTAMVGCALDVTFIGSTSLIIDGTPFDASWGPYEDFNAGTRDLLRAKGATEVEIHPALDNWTYRP